VAVGDSRWTTVRAKGEIRQVPNAERTVPGCSHQRVWLRLQGAGDWVKGMLASEQWVLGTEGCFRCAASPALCCAPASCGDEIARSPNWNVWNHEVDWKAIGLGLRLTHDNDYCK
jgi:hypothetical protein